MRVSDDVSLPSSPRSFASDISMPLITDSSSVSEAALQNRYRLHPLGVSYKRCLLAMAFIGLFADYYLLTVIIPFLPNIVSKSYSTFAVSYTHLTLPTKRIV